MEKDNLATATSRLTEAAGATAQAVKEEVRDRADAVAQTARATSRGFMTRLTDMIRANPLMAVLIAAAIGYLFGASGDS